MCFLNPIGQSYLAHRRGGFRPKISTSTNWKKSTLRFWPKNIFRKINFWKNRRVFFSFTKKNPKFLCTFYEPGGSKLFSRTRRTRTGFSDFGVGPFLHVKNAKNRKKTKIEKMQSAGATDEKKFFDLGQLRSIAVVIKLGGVPTKHAKKKFRLYPSEKKRWRQKIKFCHFFAGKNPINHSVHRLASSSTIIDHFWHILSVLGHSQQHFPRKNFDQAGPKKK